MPARRELPVNERALSADGRTIPVNGGRLRSMGGRFRSMGGRCRPAGFRPRRTRLVPAECDRTRESPTTDSAPEIITPPVFAPGRISSEQAVRGSDWGDPVGSAADWVAGRSWRLDPSDAKPRPSMQDANRQAERNTAKSTTRGGSTGCNDASPTGCCQTSCSRRGLQDSASPSGIVSPAVVIDSTIARVHRVVAAESSNRRTTGALPVTAATK